MLVEEDNGWYILTVQYLNHLFRYNTEFARKYLVKLIVRNKKVGDKCYGYVGRECEFTSYLYFRRMKNLTVKDFDIVCYRVVPTHQESGEVDWNEARRKFEAGLG